MFAAVMPGSARKPLTFKRHQIKKKNLVHSRKFDTLSSAVYTSNNADVFTYRNRSSTAVSRRLGTLRRQQVTNAKMAVSSDRGFSVRVGTIARVSYRSAARRLNTNNATYVSGAVFITRQE